MWKFRNYHVTQILCEINFCGFGVSKFVILAASGPLNIDFDDFSFALSQSRSLLKQKFKAQQIGQNSSLSGSIFAKIDFT